MMQHYLRWLCLLVLLTNSCHLSPGTDRLFATPLSTTADHQVDLQLADHVSGTAMTVAIQDHYAYLGFSYEFVVLDISDRTAPKWRAALPLPANEIVLAGDYAYVVGRAGFAVVDIGEPTAPKLVSTLALPATPTILTVSADHAYVVIYGDLYTLSLADPAQPRLLDTLRLTTWVTGLTAVGTTLYMVSDQGLHRFDLADPAQPRSVDLLAIEQLRYGPLLADGRLYFGHQKALWVKDLASAAPPRVLIPDTVLDAILDIAVVDKVVYLAAGFQGLHVWEIANQTKAVDIGAYPLNGLTNVLVAQAGYLYTMDCDEGLHIFDMTKPRALTAVGNFIPLGMTYNLAVQGDFAYVASGFNNGVHRVRLTNPGELHTIDTHLNATAVRDLAIADELLYLALDSGVAVLELANPTAPRQIAFYELPALWSIAAGDHQLYVSDVDGNFWLFDRTVPTTLTPLAYYPAFGYAGELARAEGQLYLPVTYVGLRILTPGRAGELNEIGFYARATEINKVVVAHGYAYLALGRYGLDVVDVTDPTAPRFVNHYATPGEALDLAVHGPYLLLAAGAAGLRVLDLADPTEPREIASYATHDCAKRVLSVAGVIYVVQPMGGLDLLTLTVQ